MRLPTIFRMRFPRVGKSPWLRGILIVLGLIGLVAAIWFGGPMTGIDALALMWVRLTIIGTILGLILLIWFIRWRRRVRAAAQL